MPLWIVNIALRQVESVALAQALAMPHGVVFRPGEKFNVAGVEIDVATLFEQAADFDAP